MNRSVIAHVSRSVPVVFWATVYRILRCFSFADIRGNRRRSPFFGKPKWGWALIVTLMGGGISSCGAPASPAALTGLSNALQIQGKDGDSQRWQSAKQYLVEARFALDDRDTENASRLAQLGLIEAQIAILEDKQGEMRQALENAYEREKKLQLEKERLASQIVKMEKEFERQAIRAHVESVIDESFRKAAVQELLDSSTRTPAEQAKLTAARERLGRELYALCELRFLVAEQIARTTRLIPESLERLAGTVELASSFLQTGDLASLQKYAEMSFVEYRRLYDSAFLLHTGSVDSETSKQLFERLELNELRATDEGIGISVRVESKKGRLTRDGQVQLQQVQNLLTLHKDLLVFVLVSAAPKVGPVATRNKNDALASEVAQFLIQGGVDEKRVSVHGFIFETPLTALVGTDRQIAVLLVGRPVSEMEND